MKKLFILFFVMTITRAGLAGIDPYSFYPTKMHKPRSEIFRASKRLVDISPTRPLVVKDKEGNVMYVTSNGKIMVKVDIYGSKIFFINFMFTTFKNKILFKKSYRRFFFFKI